MSGGLFTFTLSSGALAASSASEIRQVIMFHLIMKYLPAWGVEPDVTRQTIRYGGTILWQSPQTRVLAFILIK